MKDENQKKKSALVKEDKSSPLRKKSSEYRNINKVLTLHFHHHIIITSSPLVCTFQGRPTKGKEQIIFRVFSLLRGLVFLPRDLLGFLVKEGHTLMC